MCVVDIKVNEATVRGLYPSLNSTAAIRRWAQEVMDRHVEEMVAKRAGAMDLETVREKLHQMVKDVYAQQ